MPVHLISRHLVGPVFALLSLTACESDAELKPFTSGGCSLFPDSSVITRNGWCLCCFEHDLVYWRGGTAIERETADRALKACVQQKTGDEALAKLMYEGVRIGGSPYFYTWYRWGYGWPFDRKYQALTMQEKALTEELEKRYFENEETGFCSR